MLAHLGNRAVTLFFLSQTHKYNYDFPHFSAHVDYHTAEDSGVRVLTEATELFLQRLTASLRRALDTDLQVSTII